LKEKKDRISKTRYTTVLRSSYSSKNKCPVSSRQIIFYGSYDKILQAILQHVIIVSERKGCTHRADLGLALPLSRMTSGNKQQDSQGRIRSAPGGTGTQQLVGLQNIGHFDQKKKGLIALVALALNLTLTPVLLGRLFGRTHLGFHGTDKSRGLYFARVSLTSSALIRVSSKGSILSSSLSFLSLNQLVMGMAFWG